MNYSAAILSGGLNTRFGGEMKSLALLNSRPILDYILIQLYSTFKELILVTNTPQLFHQYKHLKIVADIYPHKGALSGIHAALYHSNNENVFIVAGDMPFISKEVIQKQINLFETAHADVLVPKHSQNTEFLHGIYSKKVIPQLENTILNGENLSVGGFISKMKTFYWETEYYKGFENINTRNDMKRWNF